MTISDKEPRAFKKTFAKGLVYVNKGVLRRFIRRNKGFTLIEMLIVIIIIALILSIAVPAAGTVLGRAKEVQKQATERNIQMAAMAAMLETGIESGTFEPDDNQAFSNYMNNYLAGTEKWNKVEIENGEVTRLFFETDTGSHIAEQGPPADPVNPPFTSNLPTPPPPAPAPQSGTVVP